ncbi:unnamed protein product [Microthlaspi erraticum]|uniref:GDSL esterase/lipase n=1 Tax=Microthlaspi erraticum TaxID=1685480 RepID=A0A6D2JMF2_9BRAS|nr:unnamed protein product [Microthlaspi erraticum]
MSIKILVLVFSALIISARPELIADHHLSTRISPFPSESSSNSPFIPPLPPFTAQSPAIASTSFTRVPALFVFGDSSVDCGTNNFLGTLARADRLPYGRDFDTHQPTGRFCNGRIPVDFLDKDPAKMSGGLDMSLDDIIKSNRKPTGSRGRGNGGSSSGGRVFGGTGSGPSRRFANRVGNRAAPYSRPVQQQAHDAMWQNDVFATDASVAAAFGHQSAGIGGSSIETGTKLYISNLDYGVSNEDIKVFPQSLSHSLR